MKLMFDNVNSMELMFNNVNSIELICNNVNFTELISNDIYFMKLIFDDIDSIELTSDDIDFVISFLTLQRGKVTVLHLLYHELYCLKLTRDYVTTLTNYKGWVAFTTKVGQTILTNY